MARDMRALGAPEEHIAAQIRADQQRRASDAVEVLWENRRAVAVFLAVQSQWRHAPMGGLLGLDYTGLESAMRMMRIRRRRDTFARVRAIESGALSYLEEHRRRKERQARR